MPRSSIPVNGTPAGSGVSAIWVLASGERPQGASAAAELPSAESSTGPNPAGVTAGELPLAESSTGANPAGVTVGELTAAELASAGPAEAELARAELTAVELISGNPAAAEPPTGESSTAELATAEGLATGALATGELVAGAASASKPAPAYDPAGTESSAALACQAVAPAPGCVPTRVSTKPCPGTTPSRRSDQRCARTGRSAAGPIASRSNEPGIIWSTQVRACSPDSCAGRAGFGDRALHRTAEEDDDAIGYRGHHPEGERVVGHVADDPARQAGRDHVSGQPGLRRDGADEAKQFPGGVIHSGGTRDKDDRVAEPADQAAARLDPDVRGQLVHSVFPLITWASWRPAGGQAVICLHDALGADWGRGLSRAEPPPDRTVPVPAPRAGPG